MIRAEIKELIQKAIKSLWDVDLELAEIKIDYPPEGFGDYSTNIAMAMSKITKGNPMEIAEEVAEHLSGNIVRAEAAVGEPKSRTAGEQIQTNFSTSSKNNFCLFQKIEVVNPGFINFYLAPEILQKQISEILEEKENFGKLEIGAGQKIQVEFISANPTGPLTLGNGRGGFYGDVLANILTKAGFDVEREYYVNDVGEQIRKLGHSVLCDEEAVYKGDYIDNIKKKINLICHPEWSDSEAKDLKTEDSSPRHDGAQNDNRSVETIGEKAAKIIIEEIIKSTIENKMKIKFDRYFFESGLYPKKVDETIEFLKEKNLTYEQDGALWFKSTQFGDDKDRVLIKAGGEKTYLASDVAYLKNKFERGFIRLIYIWGADHHGYIDRLRAVTKALDYNSDDIKIIIMQLVRLMSEGKEVRMSKREGMYVEIEKLIDEVGLDVARFFFLMYSPGAHMNFDLDLAKERSQKNPVYYVQYAYARICSIIAKVKSKNEKEKRSDKNLELLNHESELRLIKQLIRFPEIIEDTARDYQVHRLPHYALDLVRQFHKFYEECRVIDEKNHDMTKARLFLVRATQIVLKNSLDLMGIYAPEKM